MRRDRGLQVEIVGVAVFPHVAGRRRHRGNDGWRWAETAFIGSHAGAEGFAAITFQRLRPDERNGRRQGVNETGEGGAVDHCPIITGHPAKSTAQAALAGMRAAMPKTKNPAVARRVFIPIEDQIRTRIPDGTSR